MKLREINENPAWRYWLPDALADWSAPSHWERARLASMQERLSPGDVLYDVGTEHGWLTAVYGGFGGYENVVLFEPSVDLWTNIRLIWEHNAFPGPLACFQVLVGAETVGMPDGGVWPDCAYTGEETGHMHYRSLVHHTATIPTLAIDDVPARFPDAITIDVEGAEYEVLRGAAGTLATQRPLVWVSIHPDLMLKDFDADPAQLHQFMADLDYEGTLLEVDHEEHWLFWPEGHR